MRNRYQCPGDCSAECTPARLRWQKATPGECGVSDAIGVAERETLRFAPRLSALGPGNAAARGPTQSVLDQSSIWRSASSLAMP